MIVIACCVCVASGSGASSSSLLCWLVVRFVRFVCDLVFVYSLPALCHRRNREVWPPSPTTKQTICTSCPIYCVCGVCGLAFSVLLHCWWCVYLLYIVHNIYIVLLLANTTATLDAGPTRSHEINDGICCVLYIHHMTHTTQFARTFPDHQRRSISSSLSIQYCCLLLIAFVCDEVECFGERARRVYYIIICVLYDYILPMYMSMSTCSMFIFN